MRTVVLDVPPQDVITKDNVSVKVNAVVYFRVVDPNKAVVSVENYLYATSQLSQTTLRSVLGQAELDELLAEREKLNEKLQEIIDQHTDPWGIKVSMVEVKHVDLPQEMQRAMARQAEAEREKRAKIIHAEGELQASEKLLQAAQMLAQQAEAMQLRYLQTLTSIAGDKSTTIVFPVPMDVIGPILEAARYAISHPTLGVLILLAIAPGSIGLSYTWMLPVAAEELGIRAGGLGALVMVVGVGGLVAGVSLETIQRRIGLFGELTSVTPVLMNRTPGGGLPPTKSECAVFTMFSIGPP